MRDVFISHVEEDAGIAQEIARGLEKAGYAVWYYERDSIPGPSYLLQTGGAVEECRAFVLLISPHSLGSNQVTAEVVRAHEGGKPFIPVLRGISHAEFQNRQPLWRQAVGSASSVAIGAGGVQAIVPRLVAGLGALGISPGEEVSATELRPSVPGVVKGIGGGAGAAQPKTTPAPLWQDRKVWAGVAGVAVLALVAVWLRLASPIKPMDQFAGEPTAVAITGSQPTTAPILPAPTGANTAAPVAASTAAPTFAPAAPVAAPSNLQVTVLAIEDSGSGYAWSPDGRTLVIGGSDMKLYDTQALKVAQTIRVDSGSQPVYSPDGTLLALLTPDGVELWDTTGWGPIQSLTGSKDTECVAFAPDGKTLATATGAVVKVWDVASGQELRTIPVEGWHVVAFSPDGHTLAAPSGSGGDIKLWDATTGEELRTLKGHSNGITGLTFSPDGTLLASSSDDQTARLWDVASGRPLRTLRGHTKSVDSVALSPDGRLVATASMDLTVRLWDAASGQELKNLTGHTSWVSSVSFSPDGTMLLSGASRDMRLWGLSEGPPPEVAPTATPRPTVALPGLSAAAISATNAAGLKQVRSLAVEGAGQVGWARDGRQIAVAGRHIQLYDADTLQPGMLFDAMQSMDAFAFSPDGRTLASAWRNGGVQVWDLGAGVEVLALEGSQDSSGIAFSPDGALLATTTGQTIKLWDAASGRELYTLPCEYGSALAFSPVEPIVAAGAGDYDSIALWDATTGQQAGKLSGLSDRPDTVAFSRDGTLLAAASDDTIIIWEVASGRQRRRFAPPEPQTRSLAFSPDGTVLAVATGPLIVVWDVESGEELCTLTGHSSYVDTVAFSPDGALLASGAGDGTVRLWGVAP